MSIYGMFTTDAELETKGVTLNYGVNSKGNPIDITIARAGGSNTKYARILELKVKPYRRQVQTETIENSTIEKLLIEVYAESIVLGWANVEDKAGNPMLFSRDNCIKLLTDLPDLFADIKEQSQRVALFRVGALEADAKN